jgi:signal transduction histidine kinase
VALALGVLALAAIAVSAWIWKLSTDALAAELRARAEAERRLLEAEAAGRAAADFVALARQSLQRPLQAVLSGAESLRRTAPAMRAQADRIGDAGGRAHAMLDDLRDLADLDAGRLRIERAAFDLPALMSEVAQAWEPRARARGLNLEIDGAAALPRAMLGDRDRLRQVLDGLIGAALEVTDVGGVSLAARAVRLAADERRKDDDACWLIRFEVSDNGPGLRNEEMPRLFAPFDDSAEASGRAGAALERSVGRGLARLMGGDLYATGHGGRGAAFTLEVTLADPPTAAMPATLGAAVTPGARVLVVDGQEKSRRAAVLMLEPLGLQLTAAGSADSAMELLAVRAFDVVLMDLSLPAEASREACRRLRAAPGPNQATPVLGCLAAGAPREAWMGASLSGLIDKPFDAAGLQAALAAALKPRPRRNTAAA